MAMMVGPPASIETMEMLSPEISSGNHEIKSGNPDITSITSTNLETKMLEATLEAAVPEKILSPEMSSDKAETNTTGAAVPEKMAEREAKKRRLRELRETYDCVKTIVNHMGKYYRNTEPPPWLDLRVVCSQLMRSPRARPKNSGHAAWRHLRESIGAVEAWMSDYKSWTDAVQMAKMPYLGTSSEIMALEFIDGGPCIPKCFMQSLRQLELNFLVETHPRSEDQLPDFWKGAKLNDPLWRHVYMAKGVSHNIPFNDDLTDLVLSTVCHKGKPDLECKTDLEDSPLLFTSALLRNGEDIPGPPKSGTDGKPDAKTGGASRVGESGVWKDKVQATMSRIADTVTEALAQENVKLLGKRYRQDNETTQPDDPKKRQKTVETHLTQKIMDTIEDIDDDRRSPSLIATTSVAKEDERFRALKAGYKKLKKQDQHLAAFYSSLEENNKKLTQDIEKLSKQHERLRKDFNAEKRAHQQLVDECAGLENRTKNVEEKSEQTSVQCAALTDDARKLEDKSGQTAAQCTAFEDENKILRAQIVSLMARVEALEGAKSAPKPQEEPEQTAASAPTDGTRPVDEAPRAPSRQPSIQAMSNNRPDSRPRGNAHGGAAPIPPPPQWQSAAAVKYETIDTQITKQPPKRPPGARFTGVLDMPTFEPDWDPAEEVVARRRAARRRAAHVVSRRRGYEESEGYRRVATMGVRAESV